MRLLLLTVLVSVIMTGTAGADPHTAGRPITPACEEALALSALPKRLRAGASVFVLTDDGYRMSRSGDGPFTCIVGRNHAEALIPQCPDAAGLDSVIPGIILKSQLALAGAAIEARQAEFEKKKENGDLSAPDRPGVSYMMSNFNYAWNHQAGGLMRIPPHVMFYAPNLSNDDIGGSMQEGMGSNRGVPFIIEEGIHGYMTSMVEHPSDSSDVFAACDGQLPEVAGTIAASGGGS